MKKLILIICLVLTGCLKTIPEPPINRASSIWTRYADFDPVPPYRNTYLKTTFRSKETITADEANKVNSEVNAISRYLLEGWLNTNLLTRLTGIESTQGVFEIKVAYNTYTNILQQTMLTDITNVLEGVMQNPMTEDLDMNLFSINDVSNINLFADLSNKFFSGIYINDTNISKTIFTGYKTNEYGASGYQIKVNSEQAFFADERNIWIGSSVQAVKMDKTAQEITIIGDWGIDIGSNKISNVADPVEDMDAVNLRTLNAKIVENSLPVNLLNIENFDYEQYEMSASKVYYNPTDFVMANPVIDEDAGNTVNNLALSCFTTENYINDILLTFDDDVSNTNVEMTICGFVAGKTRVETEYGGTALIKPYTNFVEVLLENVFIDADTVVLITPYKSAEVLYNYWYEYIDTNAFKIWVNCDFSEALQFKWIIPEVINGLISSPNFIFGRTNVVAGNKSSALLVDGSSGNYWGNYTNALCFLTPLTASSNLYFWSQQRDLTDDEGAIKIVIDEVQDRNLYFDWTILIK